MDESYKYNIEWKKSFIIDYIQYGFIYLKFKIKSNIVYGSTLGSKWTLSNDTGYHQGAGKEFCGGKSMQRTCKLPITCPFLISVVIQKVFAKLLIYAFSVFWCLLFLVTGQRVLSWKYVCCIPLNGEKQTTEQNVGVN